MAFLSSCLKWRNVELGRMAFKSVLKLDDGTGSAYSLTSNIYARGQSDLQLQHHRKQLLERFNASFNRKAWGLKRKEQNTSEEQRRTRIKQGEGKRFKGRRKAWGLKRNEQNTSKEQRRTRIKQGEGKRFKGM
ncbi:uncharacterized protein LOC112351687 [Selaginella moellendorffii]|uniref:uncharacterized protein LOC112351687 n=1 Tax=Selaginella moellendorffii TaxID=88036 RepID=UPI000D1CAB10|nr:uncharacterized protein LOC112351687 [Selaginella moellendorffii]|eukprot:XP_024545799.1 uncharacterized protein LOC112351687 [Selaginella moellendorffii]